MPAFPIGDSIEETIANALDAGYSEPGQIAGQITPYLTCAPSPAEIADSVEAVKADRDEEPELQESPQGPSPVTDRELRAALEAADVSGERAGELSG